MKNIKTTLIVEQHFERDVTDAEIEVWKQIVRTWFSGSTPFGTVVVKDVICEDMNKPEKDLFGLKDGDKSL